MSKRKRLLLFVGAFAIVVGVFLYDFALILDAGLKCCSQALIGHGIPRHVAGTSAQQPVWNSNPALLHGPWTVPLTAPAIFDAGISGTADGATQYSLTILDGEGSVRGKFVHSGLSRLSFGGFCGIPVGSGERLTLRIVPFSAGGVRGEERVLEFTAPRLSPLQHIAQAGPSFISRGAHHPTRPERRHHLVTPSRNPPARWRPLPLSV